MRVLLLATFGWVSGSVPSAARCSDPIAYFSEGANISDCSHDDFRSGSYCTFSCAEDYHSTNVEKAKTKITCTCEGLGLFKAGDFPIGEKS